MSAGPRFWLASWTKKAPFSPSRDARPPATDPTETADAIAAAVSEFRREYEVEAVGIGAAGWIDETRSLVRFAPKPGLAGRAAARHRRGPDRACRSWSRTTRTPLPGASTGSVQGAAHTHLILITVGTGIGCGIILDGRLYRGRFGVGGEPGHVRVVPDGRRCGCGNRGCWEQYCSGRALEREAREIVAASPAAGAALLEAGERRHPGDHRAGRDRGRHPTAT